MAARNENGYSAKGKLYEIFETKSMSDKFKKREFILEYGHNPQYPQYIKFDLQNDYCNLINDFQLNDEVEVYFDLKGKPYTNKNGEKIYFTNLVAWKIVDIGGSKSEKPQPAAEEAAPGSDSTGDDFEDLPF